MLGIEPTVTLVNRQVDEAGQRIPYTFVYDSQPVTFVDTITIPIGPARIIVHNSMYRTGPNGNDYRLGVAEWNLPCDPLPPTEFRDELIDREALGYPRQTVKGTKLGKGAPLRNPTPRREPTSINNPGGKDGAFPGHYGEVRVQQ